MINNGGKYWQARTLVSTIHTVQPVQLQMRDPHTIFNWECVNANLQIIQARRCGTKCTTLISRTSLDVSLKLEQELIGGSIRGRGLMSRGWRVTRSGSYDWRKFSYFQFIPCSSLVKSALFLLFPVFLTVPQGNLRDPTNCFIFY